ncbi:MAG: T9SS type A sorting domain-containing protein [Cytophagaceae bacterium]
MTQLFKQNPVYYSSTMDKSITWSPISHLSFTNPTSPLFNAPNNASPTNYKYTMRMDSASCLRKKSITIHVKPSPVLSSLVMSICPGKKGIIPIANNINQTYEWTNTNREIQLSSISIANPEISVDFNSNDTLNNKTYGLQIKIINQYLCGINRTYLIQVLSKPPVYAGPDKTIQPGQEVQLGNPDASNPIYHPTWTVLYGDPGGISNTHYPTISPNQTSEYILKAYKSNLDTNSITSCYNYDTVKVTVIPILHFDNQSSLSNVFISPNPCEGVIQIEMSPFINISVVEIMDYLGNFITKADQIFLMEGKYLIDLHELPPGNFILRIKTNTSVLHQKIVKK